MIKDLIKMATRLDSMGLKREADTVDSLIKKISSRSVEKRDQYEECECSRCGAKVVQPLGESCICNGCKPEYLRGLILDHKEFLEDAPEKLERYIKRLKRAVESGNKYEEETMQRMIEEHPSKIMIAEEKLRRAKDQLAELIG
jgi:hypothetical protein